MELDPRIKSLSDILTCFDTERAKDFIGQKGYFADDLYRFDDLRYLDYGTLTDVDVYDRKSGAFHRRDANFYQQFFIPECRLRPEEKKPDEKKYRPYTPEEFCATFCAGQKINFRKKDDPESEQSLTAQGIWFSPCYGELVTYARMESHLYSFDALFSDFEWRRYYQKDFVPFGVEVEE